MSADDDQAPVDLVEFVPQSVDVPLACEVCGRVLTKVRIGPAIVRSGWRCSRSACSPEREAAPVHHAGADSITTTTTVAKRGDRGDGT